MHQPAHPLTSSLCRNITELISNGSFKESLFFYKQLHSSGIQSTTAFLPSIFKACTPHHHLAFALQLHCTILKTAHISHTITLNSLISVYSKNSLFKQARQLFDESPHRDLVTWSQMINCYIQNGYFSDSLQLLRQMYLEGHVPKPELVAAVVSVCGRIGNLHLGMAIHARAIIDAEFATCILLPSALIDMYSRCGDLMAAMDVFNLMNEKNVISWTAMVAGCITNGDYGLSLEYLRCMALEGIKPNRVALITVLPACGLKHGKEIHGYIIRQAFESEARVVSTLIEMYGRCSDGFRLPSLVFERAAERDVVTWSSMLGCFLQSGNYIVTIKFLQCMHGEGIRPNSVTMLALVAACVGLESLDLGRGMHSYILKSGLFSDVFVGNSLIDMYGKCGCLESSVRIFSEMPLRDSISYSSMISSYGIHGRGCDALRLYDEMTNTFKPDSIALLAVLSACNHSGLISEGEKLFKNVNGDYDIVGEEHYACYIDLLGKSGKIKDAFEVARSMPMKPSSRILSSLGSACRIHGRSEVAERLAKWLIDSEPTNGAHYTLLSGLYAESGNWVQMEKVRRVMNQRRVKKEIGTSQVKNGNKDVCLSII